MASHDLSKKISITMNKFIRASLKPNVGFPPIVKNTIVEICLKRDPLQHRECQKI
jgi:hypothetical protein